jgi:alcohol dehydrogenase class IV
MIAQILTPRMMLIGGDAAQEIALVLHKLGVHRPLIVTDPFMRDSGMLKHVTDPLDSAGIRWDLFADTVPDPTTDVVEAGLGRLRLGTFDSLIAFGGGSPMDTAKAMNALAALGGRMRDHKVPKAADKSAVPLICIPTTAGTGSEVTKFCVITDTETDEKMLIMGLGCLPTAVLVDYKLTMKKPFRLTADTGIDSITHAVEAYVSKKRNPMSDVYALTAMRRLYTHIRTACFEPENEQAREQMMLGATQAGMAFSNASVALVHGMSRPIGAFFHVPHGLSNAMLLPAVTEFSAEAALDRYADCARAMGIAPEDEGNQSAVNRLIDGLRRLNDDLKVPTPKAYGIDEARYMELLGTMASQALASGSPGNNPRVPDEAEIIDLYKRVYA